MARCDITPVISLWVPLKRNMVGLSRRIVSRSTRIIHPAVGCHQMIGRTPTRKVVLLTYLTSWICFKGALKLVIMMTREIREVTWINIFGNCNYCHSERGLGEILQHHSTKAAKQIQEIQLFAAMKQQRIFLGTRGSMKIVSYRG